MIKAIETHYKGYRFRSRLEARWAVFFDALGIDWQYEPEGFILKDGTMYLPDFFLTKLLTWIEVKNPSALSDDENWRSANELAKGTGHNSWVVGDLNPDSEKLHFGSGYENCDCYAVGPLYDKEIAWRILMEPLPFIVECRACGEILIECDMAYGHNCDKNERAGFVSDRIIQAYKKARSARFEHGERP